MRPNCLRHDAGKTVFALYIKHTLYDASSGFIFYILICDEFWNDNTDVQTGCRLVLQKPTINSSTNESIVIENCEVDALGKLAFLTEVKKEIMTF